MPPGGMEMYYWDEKVGLCILKADKNIKFQINWLKSAIFKEGKELYIEKDFLVLVIQVFIYGSD